MCGSNLSFPLPAACPNCKADTQSMEIGGIVDRHPDPKGKQYNPYQARKIIQKDVPVIASTKDSKKKKKKKDVPELPRLSDKFVSEEEFKTCREYSDYKNYDDEEVEKSCVDLAIDG